MKNAGPSRLRSAAGGLLTGVAGLCYAYLVWNAVAYLISMSGVGLSGYGWFVLLFAAALPMIVFAAALALGRRRPIWEFGLVLLAGLGLSAVFWLDVLSLTLQPGSGVLLVPAA